ncbi:MAG: class I SAM-dependent rRNA methyltransferase [bacterium]
MSDDPVSHVDSRNIVCRKLAVPPSSQANPEKMPTLKLKRVLDRRARAGHAWIFSNELESADPGLAPGDAVRVLDAKGRFLGSATYHPNSLIIARFYSRQLEPLGPEQLRARLSRAAELRARLYPDRRSFRVVHSEADELPGLILDRYGDQWVIQFLTVGMERRREALLAAVRDLFAPASLLERSEGPALEHEGLSPHRAFLWGETRGRAIVDEEYGSFEVDLLEGQKTGFFLDQRENRLNLRGRVEGRRVLDLFSYVGAWSVAAAKFGAAEVLAVDSSTSAVALAEANFRRNDVQSQCRAIAADAFDFLREQERNKTQFDAIILDPPAFAKSRKQVRSALRGYHEINLRALRLLAPGGLLFTCSCSHHVTRELFQDMVRGAAADARRQCRLLAPLSQSPDHPILLGTPETEYLKGLVLEVL